MTLYESSEPDDKRCLVYCGDDNCTCECHPRFQRDHFVSVVQHLKSYQDYWLERAVLEAP